MALDDPMTGKQYVSARDMPHYDELARFLERLDPTALREIDALIAGCLDAVPIGGTIAAREIIPGRTHTWQPPLLAIYEACARTVGVSDPYKLAALRYGQMVKAAVIDRDDDWWRIFRTSRETADGDEITFAVYERRGHIRP